MIVSDVAQRDWHLYFNGTIMRHDRYGIVSVQVNERNLLYQRDGDWREALPSELTCVWPDACAINFNNRGVYVARRSRREARRSASTGHYYIGWSPNNEGAGCSIGMLRYLCFPDEYPSFDFAFQALEEQSRQSIAISPEIILSAAASKNICQVVYKLNIAGKLSREEQGYAFEPLIENSPAARRTVFRLQKEGLLCH